MRHNAQYKRLKVVNACSSAGALIHDSSRKNRIFQAWVWRLKINIYLGMFLELLYSLGSFHSVVPFVTAGARRARRMSSHLGYFVPPPKKIPRIVASLCSLRDELLTSFNEEERGQRAMVLPQSTWDGENKVGQGRFNLNPVIISQERPQKPMKLCWSKAPNWEKNLWGLISCEKHNFEISPLFVVPMQCVVSWWISEVSVKSHHSGSVGLLHVFLMSPGKCLSLHSWEKNSIFVKNIKNSPFFNSTGFEVDSVLLAFFQHLLWKYFPKQFIGNYQN